MRPVIGLPVCQQDGKQQFVTQTYLNAVTDSGGLPLLLPLLPDQISSDTYLKLCDGFLFCGGGDITPLLFGQEPLTSRGTTDLAMDRFHLDLMTQALESQKPILAICRGMQVMNVALGGSLFQDLSLRPLPSLSHMQPSLLRSDPSHTITLQKHSMLSDILGDTAYVNSFHHQCIDRPGRNLRVTAQASDGVIEAIEQNRHPFAIGVQWHPECLYHSQPSMKKLFTGLVNASAGIVP